MITMHEQSEAHKKAQVLQARHSPDLNGLRRVKMDDDTFIFSKDKKSSEEEIRTKYREKNVKYQLKYSGKFC